MISPSLVETVPKSFFVVGTYPTRNFYLRTVIVTGRLLGLRFVASQKLTTPLNLPAPGRRQPYTSPYGLAETCVLINSRLGLFTAALLGVNPKEHPFSPKLRGHFAEFLNESSLAHLRILILTTCVGLRYGHLLSI